MKKILPIVLSALLLTSCSHGQISSSSSKSSSSVKVDSTTSKLTISDIFPFKKNVQLNYTSSSDANSNWSFYVDYVKNNRIQFRLVNNDSSTGYVLENTNGELKMITTRDEFFYHDDITSTQNPNAEILLKEPLVKGTSWKLPNGNKRYISDDNIQIATASQKYIALEVTTETNDGKIIDYYAPNVGLVKKIVANSKSKTITSLESINENASATETVKFYYPNPIDGNSVFYKRQLHFKTDDYAKTYFEKYFKETPSDKLSHVFTPNVKINKLYLDDIEKKVYIDISKDFEKDMNLGASSEEQVLKCITNTLCDYFNVDKLTLTVDGMPYQSGHIAMKPNESMYLDVKNIQELK